jgi:2-polyprenyl-3-methyl-5-hydroxy-6-metoxy-1,4-benzoquinol methylase
VHDELSPSIDRQRDFYDTRWGRMEWANRLQLERTIAILEALRATKLSSPSILEVGCGTGWLTAILGRFGQATGVELSTAAVARAQATYPDVRFQAVDLSTLPELESYDVVVSHEVIEHLEDQASHLGLLARCVRPAGFLILTTPNGRYRAFLSEDDGPQPIENWLTRSQLRHAVSRHFTVLHCRSILLGRGHSVLQRLLLSKKLRAAMGLLALRTGYEGVLNYLGFGRHLVLVAQRPS